VSKVLYARFELVVAVQVGRVPRRVQRLAKLGFEAVHDQSDLQTGVRSKHRVRVNSFQLQGPLSNHNHFFSKVVYLHLGEPFLKFI
jgi:hypothetical protein